jgi:hypothetical protein
MRAEIRGSERYYAALYRKFELANNLAGLLLKERLQAAAVDQSQQAIEQGASQS